MKSTKPHNRKDGKQDSGGRKNLTYINRGGSEHFLGNVHCRLGAPLEQATMIFFASQLHDSGFDARVFDPDPQH